MHVFRMWKRDGTIYQLHDTGTRTAMNIAVGVLCESRHESTRGMSPEGIEDALRRGVILETPLSYIATSRARLLAMQREHQQSAAG